MALVNGAIGATGIMAVQMAKYHNAAAIITTGRSPEVLQKIKKTRFGYNH